MIPGCSACGYAVDWLRSCYYSQRRLFRGRPELVTRGRYYFAPAGAPFLRGPHIFGSLNYVRGEIDRGGDLGEVLDAPRPWYNGRIPGPIPLPVIVGDRGCLTDGAPYPPGALPPGVKVIYGMDSRCFVRTFEPGPTRGVDWNVTDPSVLLALAQILDWMYRDESRIRPTLETWLAPTVPVDIVFNSDSLIPGTVIVRTTNYTLVFISGTSNRQQLATQAILTATPQMSGSLFSTNHLWFIAMQAVAARVTAAGVDPSLPIIITGDSYGGAVATLLAATYHSAQPNRDVRLITFGMPKPGDSRIDVALGNIPRAHLVNDTDPVPDLPPDVGILSYLAVLVPGTVLARWRNYAPPDRRYLLLSDGTYSQDSASTMTWALLLQIVGKIIDGEPLDAFGGHSMTEYLRRLRLAAPTPPLFPVDAEVRSELVDVPGQLFFAQAEADPGGSFDQFS